MPASLHRLGSGKTSRSLPSCRLGKVCKYCRRDGHLAIIKARGSSHWGLQSPWYNWRGVHSKARFYRWVWVGGLTSISPARLTVRHLFAGFTGRGRGKSKIRIESRCSHDRRVGSWDLRGHQTSNSWISKQRNECRGRRREWDAAGTHLEFQDHGRDLHPFWNGAEGFLGQNPLFDSRQSQLRVETNRKRSRDHGRQHLTQKLTSSDYKHLYWDLG